MNGAEFRSLALAAIAKGQPLVVEVLPGVDNFEQELVIDAGMRGRIVGVTIADGFDEDTPIYKFHIDLGEYLEYNKPFQRSNWYFAGKDERMGTATETGNWPKDNVDELWLSSKDQASAALRIVEGQNHLHMDYLMDPVAMEQKETYVSWLERQLELERAKFAAAGKVIKNSANKLTTIERYTIEEPKGEA